MLVSVLCSAARTQWDWQIILPTTALSRDRIQAQRNSGEVQLSAAWSGARSWPVHGGTRHLLPSAQGTLTILLP